MTTRHLRTRLAPELAFPGHHRKDASRVGEAVADLHRLTLEAFADATAMCRGFVIVTLHATKPRRDGMYRPRLPWMVGFAAYPILQALTDSGVIDGDNCWPVYRREYVTNPDEECIEVELRPVEEELK